MWYEGVGVEFQYYNRIVVFIISLDDKFCKKRENIAKASYYWSQGEPRLLGNYNYATLCCCRILRW